MNETSPSHASSSVATQNWRKYAVMFAFLACLFVPGFVYGDNPDWLPLFSKFMAFALFAISVDLVWGYTGLLSLGQGLYFGLGCYAMGYCLRLQMAASRVEITIANLPDFMQRRGLTEVPIFLAPLADTRIAIIVALVLPTLVSFLFALVTFRLKIKGVYFALITQAIVLAMYRLVINQQGYTGGQEGLTPLMDLKLFGHLFSDYDKFFVMTGVLALCFVGCYLLVQSKFGKVLTAIRDNEFRVLALGYNTAMYKTFVYTLAGLLSGLAGALFATIQGNVGPKQVFSVDFSIIIVIWVAVGGRGTLYGAVIGALLVNLGEEHLTRISSLKESWRLLLGGLFIVTVVFLPDGLLGGWKSLIASIQRMRARRRDGLAGLTSKPDLEVPVAPTNLPATPASLTIQAATDAKGV